MRYTDVIEHFGDENAVADALNITRQAVNLWKAPNRVARGAAYELQVITGGKLRVDPKLYRKKVRA